VHFVQGDLQSPPLASGSVDIVHSAGVLHHSPDTETTFRRLCEVVKPGGTFYVWLYKYEPVVTPVVNSLRAVTTRVPPKAFAGVARAMAAPFQLFCQAADSLGIRQYSRLSRREASLALMDIFGAPHAHHHTFDEVASWYRDEGFEEIWGCSDGRRGFGVCGRRAGAGAAAAGDGATKATSSSSWGGGQLTDELAVPERG
jgi:SAM-dependent methyltransferase